MKWLKKLFIREMGTANLAKERLHVILQHERSSQQHDPEMLKKLQKEILQVIAKYVKVDEEQVLVELAERAGRSILELNVTFSQTKNEKTTEPAS